MRFLEEAEAADRIELQAIDGQSQTSITWYFKVHLYNRTFSIVVSSIFVIQVLNLMVDLNDMQLDGPPSGISTG